MDLYRTKKGAKDRLRGAVLEAAMAVATFVAVAATCVGMAV